MNPIIKNRSETLNNTFALSLLYKEFEDNNLKTKLENFVIVEDNLEIYQINLYDETELNIIDTIIANHTGVEYIESDVTIEEYLTKYSDYLDELGFPINKDKLLLQDTLDFIETIDLTSEANIKTLFKVTACMLGALSNGYLK